MSKEFHPIEDKNNKNEFKSWEVHYQQVETHKKKEQSDSALKEAELNELREKAYEEGFKQGQEAAKEEINELKSNLIFWMKVFSHPSEQIEQSIKSEMVDCIFWVSKYCLEVELSVHPEKIQTIIEDALQELPSLHEGKKLFVNEEDLEWLQEQLLPKDREIILAVASKDESLGRGEFYMRDSQTEIDGKFETRLQKILHKHLPKKEESDKDFGDI